MCSFFPCSFSPICVHFILLLFLSAFLPGGPVRESFCDPLMIANSKAKRCSGSINSQCSKYQLLVIAACGTENGAKRNGAERICAWFRSNRTERNATPNGIPTQRIEKNDKKKWKEIERKLRKKGAKKEAYIDLRNSSGGPFHYETGRSLPLLCVPLRTLIASIAETLLAAWPFRRFVTQLAGGSTD